MKTTILRLQREILNKKQQQLFNVLENNFKDYVLGGGTALSLQIKHRISFDFDFFSPKTVPKNLLSRVKETIPIDRVARDTGDELTFYSKNIKITILHYPFNQAFKNLANDNNLQYFPLPKSPLKKLMLSGAGEHIAITMTFILF